MKSVSQHDIHFRPASPRARGFTLVELAIAMLVLLVGISAVAQLIPLSIQSNMRNRYDSTAVVMAERLLNQMISQPLTATQFVDVYDNNRVISLGSVAVNGLTGSPIQVVSAIPNGPLNLVRVDFNAQPVPNYNFTTIPPNSAAPIPYEVRWSVITAMQGTTVVSKRFLVGVWKRDPRSLTTSVTVEAWVQR
jgi:prepilin-type N-terminal cleavage/methylation domain-containing protein